MSRSSNSRRGRHFRCFWRELTAGDRRIEHKRRRAALKRQVFGEETKTERVHERWDKWNWD